MRHWAVLFWSTVISAANSSLMAKWEAGFIPDINSLSSNSLYKEAFVTSSVLCAIVASQMEQSLVLNIMCFNEQTETCRMAYTNISQPSQPLNPGWDCWQTIACLHPTVGRIEEGQVEKDIVCPTLLSNQCLSPGILSTFVTGAGPVYRPTTCGPPFNMTSIGCIYLDVSTSLSFCASRQACLQLGGDLISPDTPANFVALQAFLTSMFGPRLTVVNEAQFWMGLTSTDGTYRWISNNRVADAGEWLPGDPDNGNTTRCAKSYKGYKMVDAACSYTASILCERKLP